MANRRNRSRRSNSLVHKNNSRRVASAKTKRVIRRKPTRRTSSAKSRVVTAATKKSQRKSSKKRKVSTARVKRKGVKRRASSSRKHSRTRATKRKRVGSRKASARKQRSRKTSASRSARKSISRKSTPSTKKSKQPKSKSKSKNKSKSKKKAKRVLGSPKRRRESIVPTATRRRSLAPSRRRSMAPKTPAAMTKKERRMRRLTRTGADTRRLKPRKNRTKASGPVEINSYTYDVLYGQFLDEFLPKLCKENGVDIDKRSCRVMRNIFDPPEEDNDEYEVIPSITMLKKAQHHVLAEIDRQEKQSRRAGRISGMERMFYLATGERDLHVDFAMMRKMVREVKLMKFTGDDRHDMGYMDPNINRIKINSGHKMTMYDIKVTLMHEVMHGTIKRSGRPGNPEISEATEHLAMALIGDPDEFTVLLEEPKLCDPVGTPGFAPWEEDSNCDEELEQPPCREDEDWDFHYLQSQLNYLSKLGFDMEDIPDICSPPMKRHIESQLNTEGSTPKF